MTLDQVEATLRMVGINERHSVELILDMVREYAEMYSETGVGVPSETDACVCGELTEKVRSQLSALRLAKQAPETVVKVCGKCGREWPLTRFFRDARKRDGRTGVCKDCVKGARRTKPGLPKAIIGETWFG